MLKLVNELLLVSYGFMILRWIFLKIVVCFLPACPLQILAWRSVCNLMINDVWQTLHKCRNGYFCFSSTLTAIQIWSPATKNILLSQIPCKLHIYTPRLAKLTGTTRQGTHTKYWFCNGYREGNWREKHSLKLFLFVGRFHIP